MAVFVGANPYRVLEHSGPNFPSKSLQFTFVFDHQEGNRFSGQSTAGIFRETLIGAIGPDNPAFSSMMMGSML
jgi:hypothetical protein